LPPVKDFVAFNHYISLIESILAINFNYNEVIIIPQKKRRRKISIQFYVSEAEHEIIQERMAEVGTDNMSAFIRKQALNGYVLHVDLTPVQELVSLQRRCSNNMNQIAIGVNTYGGVYPHEIETLQKDYEALWQPLSDLLKHLAEIVKI